MPEFVFLAPRCKLVDGRPTFKGRCHGLVYGLLARSAIYRAFVQPAIMHIAPSDIDHAGLKVINVWLDQHDYPGRPLAIPGDGHPTGVANLARAKMLYSALDDLAALPATIGSDSDNATLDTNETPASAAPSLHHAASSTCMTSSGERIGCGLVRTH